MLDRCCVVLVPAPFQGHITPMLQLGSILQSRGFSILVAHSEYNAPETSNHPSFSFLALPDEVAELDKSFENMGNVLEAININCKAPLKDCLVRMMENEELHGQVACIIYDTVMKFVDAVAVSLKLPSMVMRPNTAAYVRAHHTLFDLQAENCLPLSESQMEENVPNFHPFKFKDMPHPLSLEIPEKVIDFFKNTYAIGSSRAIIWNTMDELEPHHLSKLQQDFNVPFFCVGPFHKMAPPCKTSLLNEDDYCMEWLDKQAPNSVLYVSLGSIAGMDEKEVMETAWGLINSGQPFLWVIRDIFVNGAKSNSQLPDGFEEIIGEKGCLVKWAPQMKVLKHSAVGGFWSHCGWNSTLESICEGVPMICRPDFADQFINSRYVTHVWNIGLEMECPLDRGRVEETVRRLMVDEEGKELRNRTIDMKHRFHESVEKGGSSYQSLNQLAEFIFNI
ncbi:transferase [Lithospermum erythrorhizon]|uniref:Transferase n=1 Tax=Lithospermum erythrorhizon TaxID=34254 RepID=A0AAV3NRZ1_LITER